ncbi:MAG: hypothetical protein AB8H80_03325 [Planctomycetota bacterium]
MHRFTLPTLVLSMAAGLAAQSNVVAGLDGRLTVIDDLTYYGRRGPAFPNGEAGMAMLNTMCNPGSVNIPWFAAMQPEHPMFGFLVLRVHNDRIEQINDWSYCKHAFTSINVNGSCGPCQDPGTGSLMGINCSDTYGPSNNASRFWLGPPVEIDPWLGTWDPVGSYFDIGDPNQAGYPAAADGVRSLNSNIFDSVEHRVTVQEVDLLTPGADYYYALQLIHKGESLANRDDNLAHRGMNPSWNGSQWSFGNNSEGQEYGSVLSRWPGAVVESGGNGNDDGRFFVASKVTPLGNGLFHYEYAVHNVDNSRGGASLRIPIDATATATNFTFGDIDDDSGNDWSAQRVGNEVVFSATQSNPLEWNSIYNFGFDADFVPGTSMCDIDEARPGPGAMSVSVETQVPGGSTIATVELFGAGCPGSTQLPIPNCAEYNVGGGTLNGSTSSDLHVFRAFTSTPRQVESFEMLSNSTTGAPVQVQAYVFAATGSQPAGAPLATTMATIGATQGSYTASFANPPTVNGAFYIGFDNTAQNIVLNDMVSGSAGLAYERAGSGAPWSLKIVRPNWSVRCITAPVFPAPGLSVATEPLVGSSVAVGLENGLASSVAWLMGSWSRTSYNGSPLPLQLPGAPGCDLLIAPQVLLQTAVDPQGVATSTLAVPNDTNLIGQTAFYQWAVYDGAANAFGFVFSNAAGLTVGN